MALTNEYPTINGLAPSWADIIVKAKPQGASLIDLKWISAINTAGSVEVGEARGAHGGRVMKRTTGSVGYENSITFYREGALKFKRALMAIAPSRGNQKILTLAHIAVIEIQHTPIGAEEIYLRRVKGARVIGDTLNMAEGTDADVIEVPFSVLEICDVIDGVECPLL
jgi:hypothetical protein